MPSVELFGAYLIAITLLTVTPGVDTLLVLRNAASGGVRAGAVTSLGVCSGLFVHALLFAVGVSLILVQTAWAFSAIKWLGACYLVWLGISSLRQAWAPDLGAAPLRQPARQVAPVVKAFREGLLSNLLNPKTALFYMAFLPQFIDPAGHVLRQSLTLAGTHFVIAMAWQCGLAVVLDRSGQRVVSITRKRLLSGLTGGVFVGLGAKLALSPQ
ncbi:LysE family translocator [Marinobacter sp. X15-166B]|uniref:LysE family translocator n=1 Tax=Marinobacter sp. X15-166B TaxID=1897620 RepID=UPI0009F562C5|nr:LysE family translocator [Marinobacter sp. X15-166B]